MVISSSQRKATMAALVQSNPKLKLIEFMLKQRKPVPGDQILDEFPTRNVSAIVNSANVLLKTQGLFIKGHPMPKLASLSNRIQDP